MPDQVPLPTVREFVPECIQNASQGIGGHLDKNVLSNSFHKFKDDAERFRFIWENPVTHDVIILEPEYEGKSDEKASEERTRGNAYFKKKSFLSATQSYSEAIINAASNAELGLAFGNRSASLYHMRRYQPSIDDAERALQHGYPAENAFKLYERQALCWKFMHEKDKAAESLMKARENLEKSGLQDKYMKQCKERMAELEKDIENLGSEENKESTNINYNRPSIIGQFGNYSRSIVNKVVEGDIVHIQGGLHKEFESMTDTVDVLTDDNSERYIQTNTDVKIGDVIVSEEPYASVLFRPHHKTHCYNCLVRVLAPVGCAQCIHVSYCSEKCRDHAWKRYHRHECRFYALFEEDWCGRIGHLAHRVIMETGVANICDAAKQPESESLPKKYREMLKMPAKSKEQVSDGIYKQTIMACFITKLLYASDVITEHQDANTKDAMVVAGDDVITLGGEILRLIQLVQLYGKGVRELMQPTDFENPKSNDIGIGFYTTCALFRHDCFPNASLIFYGNKVVMKAMRGIFEGQQVTLSFGPHFHTTGKLRRQRFLRSTYLITCSCLACKEDWPHYRDVEQNYPVFCCARCHRYVDITNIVDQALLPCSACGENMDVQVAWGQLGVAHDQFVKSLEEAVCGKSESALPGFIDFLKLMQKYIMMPWKDFLMCQFAIETTYKLRGNRKPYD